MLGDILIGIGGVAIGYGGAKLIDDFRAAVAVYQAARELAIEDRPTTRGGKDRAVPVQARHLSDQDEITFQHDGEQ